MLKSVKSRLVARDQARMAVEFAGKPIPALIMKNFLPARAASKKEQVNSEVGSSSHPEEDQTPRNGWE